MNEELKSIVDSYLKNDRQWSRPLRIAHAKFMLKEDGAKEFWQAVLDANEAE